MIMRFAMFAIFMMLMGATMPQEELDKFTIAQDTYEIETLAHDRE